MDVDLIAPTVYKVDRQKIHNFKAQRDPVT